MRRRQLSSNKSIGVVVVVSSPSLYNCYYSTVLFILILLHQNCLTSSLASTIETANQFNFCTLCPGHESVVNTSIIALVDGRTCGDLGMEAESSAKEGDDLCNTFYRYIGHAKCGCNAPPSPQPLQPCQLCEGDTTLNTLSNEQELLEFEGAGQTTCGQAQKYVSRFTQGSPQCISFQNRSTGRCNCIQSVIATQSTTVVAPEKLQQQTFCNLCRNGSHRVTNPDTIVSPIGESCGKMAYELAMNHEYDDEQQCTGMQNYLSTFCYCGVIEESSALTSEHLTSLNPSKSTVSWPSINPTSNPSNDKSSVAPSISVHPTDIPSELITTSPTVSSTVTPSSLLSSPPTTSFRPTNLKSNSPSLVLSSVPGEINSAEPSILPSTAPSKAPLSSPSLLPSKVSSPSPSSHPSLSPSIEQSSHPSPSPSIEQSSHPSSYPSSKPSPYPSFKPSSFFDRKDNCTELANGIRPKIPYDEDERVRKAESIYTIDLIILNTTSLDDVAPELQSIFSSVVSTGVSSCSSDYNNDRRIRNKNRRKLIEVGERIYFVDFVNIKDKGDGFKCANDQTTLGYKCLVAKGSIEIYYSFQENGTNHQDKTSTHILNMVLQVFHEQLEEVANQLTSIQNITLSTASPNNNPPTKTIEDGSARFSSASKALIGVAVVCTTLVIAAIFIMARGKKSGRNDNNNTSHQRSNYSKVVETRGIIPDRHIRSDDSVSNSPTISSGGRRAMAAASGWDDGARSDGSSDTSSRPSFTVQLEEASQFSNGIEATRESPYQAQHSSYLPSSVLKDLLDGNGKTKAFDMLDTVDL